MSKPCFLSFLLLALAAVLGGQTEPAVAAAGSSKNDYPTEAFVFEQSSQRVAFNNDGTSSHQQTARVRIQSDAGIQRFGLLTFSYASGTGIFEIDYVRVRKKDGTVVITPPDGIQDMAAEITRQAPFYSDLREKHVAVKGLSIGDVLEYQTHERVTKPLAPGQFWLEYNFSHDIIILEERLEVSVPRDREIKFKSPDVKPTISDVGIERIYTWVSSNLQQKEKDQRQEEAKKALRQATGRFPQPDVLISSFRSWEELGRWYEDLQKERVKPNAEIQAKAAELIKSAPDEDAKLRAIYQYVSTQFRYIGVAFGIGRYQPHSAADVLDNQYGDCKDKHTLLSSLLGAAGIKAYPALISSLREIDADVPSPSQINHVITVVPRTNGLVWLDSTAEVGPFEYLIPSLRGKHALVVWDDKPASLAVTPTDLPFKSSEKFHMDAVLSDAGTLEGNAEFSARGDTEYVLRSAFRSVPLPQWKELGQNIVAGLGFGGAVSEVTAGAPEKTDEPFHFSYKYTRKEYGDWPNRRILAPLGVIGLPAAPDEGLPSTVPLWLGPPIEMVFEGRLQIPKEYTLEVPAAIHLKKDFAEYDATYSFKDGIFVSERRLRTILLEVPKSSYDEYRKFYKTVGDDYGSYIALSSSRKSARSEMAASATAFQNSIQALPDSADKEAVRLEHDGREAAGRQDLQGALSSLYRAVAVDPKFTRAWIYLGGILMANRQTEASSDAFEKAIASDPKQPIPHEIFATILVAEHKFEEAIPEWQSFIKLAPNDYTGPAGLGSSLVSLKRYDEAVAAFESAVQINSAATSLQWQLASAYVHAGKGEKAIAVFQKLLAENPDPGMLNDASYEMADTDQAHALAIEFAEKAVRAEEEASAKIELANLKLEDLDFALKLSAYWDTLGWAEDRISNLDVSEKNLNAAWRLSQDGVVAAHLCQVYNRLHKTQAAIQMCRFAQHRFSMSSGRDLNSSSDEIRQSNGLLKRLSPGPENPKASNTTIDEIIRLRTFKLPRFMSGNINAEFFVLLASDPKTQSYKVQDTKFIKGAEKLKSQGKVLHSVDFRLPVPDKFPSRIVLRGTMGCYEYSGCEFVLFDPSSAHSLN
jgi:tetratricopeptide (TPR) repeat protein